MYIERSADENKPRAASGEQRPSTLTKQVDALRNECFALLASIIESKRRSADLMEYLSTFVLIDKVETEATNKTAYNNAEGTPSSMNIKNNVFVAHGHDEAVKQTVARFLEKLKLDVVILHERENRGKTIIEKLEANSSVGFAVILLTPDDIGGKKGETNLTSRARQNVIAELGYFVGKLGREKVCSLYIEEVEIPSDFDGVVYIPFDRNEGWKLKLAYELKSAGFSIDMNLI